MNRIEDAMRRNPILHCKSGVAAIEFALALPLLMTLLFGAVEVTRYILVTQKIEKVSSSLSDVVAQSATMSTAQLAQIITAAGQVMLPYDFEADGYAIISSVTKTGSAAPVVNWQYKGGGGYVQPSKIGAVGATATMPAGFTMVDKENVIVAEVFYSYKPLFSGMIYGNSQMYRTSIYKPRLGDLKVLSANPANRKAIAQDLMTQIDPVLQPSSGHRISTKGAVL